jgi:hypothetical protein
MSRLVAQRAPRAGSGQQARRRPQPRRSGELGALQRRLTDPLMSVGLHQLDALADHRVGQRDACERR